MSSVVANGVVSPLDAKDASDETLDVSKTVEGFESVDEFEVSDQTAVPVDDTEGDVLSSTFPASKSEEDLGTEPAYVNGVNENGTEDSSAGAQGTEVQTGGDEERPEEEKWRQRLWFVRVPKPPEDTAIKALEQEFESVRAQVKLLNESLNLKRMEKDAAFTNTKGAREAFANCRNQLSQKDEELKPLKDMKEKSKALSAELKKYTDLLVKSEPELDKAVADIEHQIQHDSLSLNEEKKLLQTLKKLRSQRDKVKEYATKAAALDELRAQIRKLEDDMNIHELEKKALLSEKQVQQQIRNRYFEEEKSIEAEIQQIVEERKMVRETLNAVYEKLQQRRQENRSKLDEFYKNRSFSRRVRELVAEKKLEEARDLCFEQMEEMHAKFIADEQYRVEYFRLWEQVRKPSFFFGDEEAELDTPVEKKSGKPKGKAEKGKATEALVVTAKATPEDVINAALAELTQPAPALQDQQQPSPAQQTEPAPETKPKPVKKSKPTVKALVERFELPVAEQDNFILPDFVKAGLSAGTEADKEKNRQHNVAAAAEAEKRKERRKKAAEQRRLKAVEAKAKDDEAKSKPVEDIPEPTGDVALEDSEKSLPVIPEPSVLATIAPAAKPATSRHHAVVQPARTTRRPSVKKKTLKAMWKQYEMYIIAAVFVLFVATIVHIVMSQ